MFLAKFRSIEALCSPRALSICTEEGTRSLAFLEVQKDATGGFLRLDEFFNNGLVSTPNTQEQCRISIFISDSCREVQNLNFSFIGMLCAYGEALLAEGHLERSGLVHCQARFERKAKPQGIASDALVV